MSYPYIIQGDNIVVVLDGVNPTTISSSHVNYFKIREAIKLDKWNDVKKLIDVSQTITDYSNGKFLVKGGIVTYNGVELCNSLAERILKMLDEGFDVNPMIEFVKRLFNNPSNRAVNELYEFLERSKLPLTPDGCFLAYKRVKQNYMDCHTGKISNHVGAVVEMPRHLVDDDPERTCSHGLHFCSLEYLAHFGGDRTVVVKVDPADVVCIPKDYNHSKVRCCRYTVIGEIDGEEDQAFTKSVQTNATSVAKIPRSGSAIRTDLPQEYDAKGRPLSMTADAVRKRIARRLGKTN